MYSSVSIIPWDKENLERGQFKNRSGNEMQRNYQGKSVDHYLDFSITKYCFIIGRHKHAQLPEYPKFIHRGEKCPCMCRTLTMQQVKKFYEIFIQTADKIKQDTLILKYC